MKLRWPLVHPCVFTRDLGALCKSACQFGNTSMAFNWWKRFPGMRAVLHRWADSPNVPAKTGALLWLSVGLLTVVLAFTGGAANPFSVLYLVHVTLAAVFATRFWTWLVTITSSAGFGLLFAFDMPHSEHHYANHLQGMWLAHTLAGTAIAIFVSRLTAALRHEREVRAKESHLLGLATLAAGAAHEIGTPLATIRVAVGELRRGLTSTSPEVLEDIDLIDTEVSRAHEVLNRMSIGAGELIGESPVATRLAELLHGTLQQLGPERARVQLSLVDAEQQVWWPVQATSQALVQLLRNAVQASPGDAVVTCSARREQRGVAIDIEDHGVGMPRETLERLGEPFFSTRDGKGLGVFIARSLIEHMGGRIDIRSAVGVGTSVRVWLPGGANE